MCLLLNKTKMASQNFTSDMVHVHLIMIKENMSIDAIVNISSFCFMYINYTKQLHAIIKNKQQHI